MDYDTREHKGALNSEHSASISDKIGGYVGNIPLLKECYCGAIAPSQRNKRGEFHTRHAMPGFTWTQHVRRRAELERPVRFFNED